MEMLLLIRVILRNLIMFLAYPSVRAVNQRTGYHIPIKSY